MGLYRMFLVDDEEEVRKGIIKKIDWQALGFCVVGDADNGRDALEKIEQLEPDVVMTDIRMPYMDGLELAAWIRKKYPSTKILIFSGYDDFEYAKQAIKLNVSEYILKPVNVEELTELLTRVRVGLDEEICQRLDVDRLRKSYQSSLPILRELFLTQLLGGSAEPGTIREKLTEYGIDLLDARRWIAAVISAEPEGNGLSPQAMELLNHRELLSISIRQLAEDHLKQSFRFALSSVPEGLAVAAAVEEDQTQTMLMDQLGDICKECRRMLGVTVTIGVGRSCSSLEELSLSYRSASDALGYRAIVGTGKTIYINDVEPVERGRLQLDPRDEAQLVSAIKFGTEERIGEAVHHLVERMEDAKVHTHQYQLYMLSILTCITRLAQQYDLNEESLFQEEESIRDLTGTGKRMEEVEGWLTRAGVRMGRAMNQARDNTTKQVIVEAKQYILEHYPDPDLSVEMLCRQFHMSPAYFSTLFKKETGQTYVGYVTEIRLNRALELLQATGDKTYVIAQKVGYQEPNYFSYVFKKRFGVSPTKFRGARQGGGLC